MNEAAAATKVLNGEASKLHVQWRENWRQVFLLGGHFEDLILLQIFKLIVISFKEVDNNLVVNNYAGNKTVGRKFGSVFGATLH
jgi:hypothetical protein